MKIKRKENTEFNNQETPLATLNRDFQFLKNTHSLGQKVRLGAAGHAMANILKGPWK